ncbi:hypothetical protein GGR88_001816 [Sphingomonas jejuensis]|uniref:Uncharacterized protein n=1 Tax=Sphingomonas jejuensis TaxID=904715 RepID=A0ABX0XN97_9SPHN|nr:hypothetical protein [Sphingomonas jejuensis]NJC34342.1 hypothetical protein [Sphingomonas jejuensis]
MAGILSLLLAAASPALSAQAAPPPPAPAAAPTAAPTIGYVDQADLALSAPVAAIVTIDRATRLRDARATGVAAGSTRFYVEADVATLLKGTGGLASRVTYLVDVPNDARGRPARLRDRRVIVLARPVPARAGELQLVAADAQIDWTPANEAQLRAILTAAAAADAPPAVTGIASGFSVAGTLPGESETQLFVQTADRRPMTLSVLRRPGETVRWAVSQTEIVDESAAPPPRDTLLWYRLACGLPRTLPPTIAAGADAERIAADYQVVLDGLGPCERQRDESETPTPAQSG